MTTLVLAATVSFFALQPVPAQAQRTSEGSAIVWLRDSSASSRKHVEVEASTPAGCCRIPGSYASALGTFVSQPLSNVPDGRAPPPVLLLQVDV
ncbi:MAG TPA: hypothetical protein VHA33_14700 [Candidatus Angelobacter sp.]|nr:hypothetical protein [Candidatus Angelobacter sp.]